MIIKPTCVKDEVKAKFQHWIIILSTIISAPVCLHYMLLSLIMSDLMPAEGIIPSCVHLSSPFCFTPVALQAQTLSFKEVLYNLGFTWVFPANVVAALDQGLSAPDCRNSPLIVPLNRKWVGRKGAVRGQFNGFRRERQREDRERERERVNRIIL